MKLLLRVALLVLVGTAAVLASTSSVSSADAAQFGGRNSMKGHMPGGGAWKDAPGRMWQNRKMLGVSQCGWRCMMPASSGAGRSWQQGSGRLWQGDSSFRYLLSVAEQPQAATPKAAAVQESAQQWRDSMPSSYGRSWQGGSTGRIWQG